VHIAKGVSMQQNLKLKVRIIERFGSQTSLARRLNLSEDRLSKFIHGRLRPHQHEAKAIARSLGVRVSEIFPD
jgi:ribosome-binding protein aMBF1 (putative translation factor)